MADMSYYTNGRAVMAEGARIAIACCAACGCALLVDPSIPFDVFDIHDGVCPGRDQ